MSIDLIQAALAIRKVIKSSVDPTVVAVRAPMGTFLIRTTAPFGIYQKLDNGLTTNWKNLDLPPSVFGDEYTYGEMPAPVQNNTGIFLQAFRLTTPALVGGLYRISYSSRITRSGATGRGQVRVQLDDVTNILPLWEQTVSNVNSSLVVSGFRTLLLGAGIHNIDYDIASTNAQFTIANEVSLEIYRVS